MNVISQKVTRMNPKYKKGQYIQVVNSSFRNRGEETFLITADMHNVDSRGACKVLQNDKPIIFLGIAPKSEFYVYDNEIVGLDRKPKCSTCIKNL